LRESHGVEATRQIRIVLEGEKAEEDDLHFQKRQ
jgi:hypothetical protein